MIDNNILLLAAFGIIIALIVVCFVMNMINTSKINTLMDYSEDGDMITALKDYYDKVDDLSKTISNSTDTVLMSRLTNCENDANMSLKKVGIENFDAYDDVKGNLSFALAILNGNNDGVIFTSLYGHNSCNTYVREITGGVSRTKLLKEEQNALEKAKNAMQKVDEDGGEEE